MKIHKTVATRAAPQDPLAGIRGPTSKGRGLDNIPARNRHIATVLIYYTLKIHAHIFTIRIIQATHWLNVNEMFHRFTDGWFPNHAFASSTTSFYDCCRLREKEWQQNQCKRHFSFCQHIPTLVQLML